jgi:hypothetical protein
MTGAAFIGAGASITGFANESEAPAGMAESGLTPGLLSPPGLLRSDSTVGAVISAPAFADISGVAFSLGASPAGLWRDDASGGACLGGRITRIIGAGATAPEACVAAGAERTMKDIAKSSLTGPVDAVWASLSAYRARQ